MELWASLCDYVESLNIAQPTLHHLADIAFLPEFRYESFR